MPLFACSSCCAKVSKCHLKCHPNLRAERELAGRFNSYAFCLTRRLDLGSVPSLWAVILDLGGAESSMRKVVLQDQFCMHIKKGTRQPGEKAAPVLTLSLREGSSSSSSSSSSSASSSDPIDSLFVSAVPSSSELSSATPSSCCHARHELQHACPKVMFSLLCVSTSMDQAVWMLCPHTGMVRCCWHVL